jgi:hypothetical protein
MSLFNLLPSEIEDIIWNLYWQDIYKTNVIDYLKNIKNLCEELNDNVNMSMIMKFKNEYSKLEYLNYYNDILIKLSIDKGTKKFSIINDNRIYYAFDIDNNITYIQYDNFKPITNYMIVKSGMMRYHVFHNINS